MEIEELGTCVCDPCVEDGILEDPVISSLKSALETICGVTVLKISIESHPCYKKAIFQLDRTISAAQARSVAIGVGDNAKVGVGSLVTLPPAYAYPGVVFSIEPFGSVLSHNSHGVTTRTMLTTTDLVNKPMLA